MAATLVAFTVPQAAEAASGDCPSGSFCVWTGTNYKGTIQKISATNSYQDITLQVVGSYYNNRSKRTWLHEVDGGGGAYSCINPGGMKSATSGWQTSPEAAYLTLVTSC